MKPTTPTKSSSGQSSTSSSTSKHKSQNKVKKSNSSSKSKSKKSSSGGSSSSQIATNSSTSGGTSSQQLTIQANLNHLHTSQEYSSPNSSSRDKVRSPFLKYQIDQRNLTTLFRLQNYQKTYVGISANSVRCIWEQYDSNETEINVDILPVLAEDASYRLWELGNVCLIHDCAHQLDHFVQFFLLLFSRI